MRAMCCGPRLPINLAIMREVPFWEPTPTATRLTVIQSCDVNKRLERDFPIGFKF